MIYCFLFSALLLESFLSFSNGSFVSWKNEFEKLGCLGYLSIRSISSRSQWHYKRSKLYLGTWLKSNSSIGHVLMEDIQLRIL